MTITSGVWHCIALDGRGACEPTDLPASISSPIDLPTWVHLDLNQASARAWLAQSGLTEIALNGLTAEVSRPRAITRGDKLQLTLRGMNLNEGESVDDMVSARLWTDGRLLISTQLRRLRSTEDVVQRLSEGRGPRHIAELICSWTDRLVERMTASIITLEDRLDALETSDDLISKKHSRALADLRKTSVSLLRYLNPLNDALITLIAHPLGWFDPNNTVLQLQDISHRLARHIEALGSLRDRAGILQDARQTQMTEAMNARMYLLSIVAAIFLPLGFITGLLGINVAGMPGADDPTAFWWVAGGCGLILSGLLVVFRVKRWL